MIPDPKVCESEHDFTLVLTGANPETSGLEDALFNAGCDDATLAFRMNRPVLTFSRSASTLKAAVLSAINDVRRAGLGIDVLRVDYCNLVTLSDIARKIGVSRQQVHHFMTGKRGPGGFPGPVFELGEGTWVWLWCEVAYWLYENNRIKKELLLDADDLEAINCILEMQNQLRNKPQLTRDITAAVGSPCPQE